MSRRPCVILGAALALLGCPETASDDAASSSTLSDDELGTTDDGAATGDAPGTGDAGDTDELTDADDTGELADTDETGELTDATDELADAEGTDDAETSGETGDDPRALRVLFVGNSYTAFNDLPAIVGALAEQEALPLVSDALAIGGATVADHVQNPALSQLLDGSTWDLVVIQGQSYEPIVQPQIFHDASVALAELAQASADGPPVMFQTWTRQPGHPLLTDLGLSPAQMTQALYDAYFAVSDATGGRLAPVGDAWQTALDDLPELELYIGDGSHPSLTGSRLAACVLLSTLFEIEAVAFDPDLHELDQTESDALFIACSAVV